MNPQQYPQPGQGPDNGYPNYPGQPGSYPQAQQPGYPQAPYGPPQSYGGAPQPGLMYPQAPQQPVAPTAGYNPNPYPGEIEKPSPNRRIFMVAGVAIVLLIFLSVFVKILQDGKNVASPSDKKSVTTANNTASSDVVTRTDDKLDLSQRIDATTKLKQQTLLAGLKQQINLSSGFSFMATDVQVYTPTDPTIVAAAGKKFIAVSVVAGNRAQSGNISVSYLDFTLHNGRNENLTPDTSSLKLLNNFLATPSSLSPGDQVNGKILYQVDAAETEWGLNHVETYQKTTDNSTFTVSGSIALVLQTTQTPAGATPTTPPAATTATP